MEGASCSIKGKPGLDSMAKKHASDGGMACKGRREREEQFGNLETVRQAGRTDTFKEP